MSPAAQIRLSRSREDIFMTFLDKLRRWKSRRDTRAILRSLDPHQLRDIGIEPGQINEIEIRSL